jgi:hypothetical protein
MSADRKKKTEPQKEADPAATDTVSRLEGQVHEMMEDFKKNCPVDSQTPVKDHRRLHGVGVRTLGFVERAFEIADLNPGFAPHYLNVKLLKEKLREMEDMVMLKNVLNQFMEFVEEAYLFKSNACYQDALKYYDSLKEYARQGNDSIAQEFFKELRPFFKSHKKKPSPSVSTKSVKDNLS